MSDEITQPQSEILTEQQVQDTVNDVPTQEEETVLPSEQEDAELIGGKFKSQEDLLEAYKNLEKKLGQPKEEEPPSEAPKDDVDPEYKTWKEQKAMDEFLKPVGGYTEYQKSLEWARDNMAESEITSFNEALKGSTNETTTMVLVKSLIEKAQAGKTNEPNNNQPLHSDTPSKPKQVSGYETKSDMLKDMSDPRYERDSSFRNKVAEKLARTDESQWYKGLPRGG